MSFCLCFFLSPFSYVLYSIIETSQGRQDACTCDAASGSLDEVTCDEAELNTGQRQEGVDKEGRDVWSATRQLSGQRRQVEGADWGPERSKRHRSFISVPLVILSHLPASPALHNPVGT
jgi:hypothetical protein